MNILFRCSVTILVLSCVSNASGQTPNLNYAECSEIISPSGAEDVCIKINFKDGKDTDYAILTYNRAKEEQNLIGFLLNGLDPITVTGNWTGGPFTEKSTYHITILSPRLKHANRFYKSEDGSTIVDGSKEDSQTLRDDTKAKEDGQSFTPNQHSTIFEMNELLELPTDPLEMNVCIVCDDKIRKKRGVNATEKYISNIFYEAKSFFEDPTMKTKIHLNLASINYIDGGDYIMQADDNTIKRMKKHIEMKMKTLEKHQHNCDSHVLICNPMENDGITGKAPIGTVCNDTMSDRIAIVETLETVAETGRNMAHELGHSIGLFHDYREQVVQAPATSRRSFNGEKCTGVGGVMDVINSPKYIWTKCSEEDFRIYHHTIMTANTDNFFCMNTISTAILSTRKSRNGRAELECRTDCKNVLGVTWYYVQHNGVKKKLLEYRPKKKFNETERFYPKIKIEEETENDGEYEFGNDVTAGIRTTNGNANLVINNADDNDTMKHAGKYRCELKQTKEDPQCPNVQESNLEVTDGLFRKTLCEGPSKEATQYPIIYLPNEPPYVWATCVVDCNTDGSCSETLKLEICQCSGFARIKTEVFNYTNGILTGGKKNPSVQDISNPIGESLIKACNELGKHRCPKCIGGTENFLLETFPNGTRTYITQKRRFHLGLEALAECPKNLP